MSASLPNKMKLVVFDFDWSMIDQDTDRWVLEVCAPELRKKAKELKPFNDWTELRARILRETCERGVTRSDIEASLREIPFHPAMRRALRSMHDADASSNIVLILSNANSIYIPTILEHHALSDTVDQIITNPAEWGTDGALHLKPRLSVLDEPHRCVVGCDAGLCKASELQKYICGRFQGGWEALEKVIYVGDGANDFCPITQLRSQDEAYVRTKRGLQERIEKEGAASGLKPKITLWDGAWQVELLLREEFGLQ